MESLKIFYISLIAVFYLVIIIFGIKSRKLIKTLTLNAVFGVVSLIIINLLSKYTGVLIPINWYSVIGVGTFGLPATGGLLLLPIIFFK